MASQSEAMTANILFMCFDSRQPLPSLRAGVHTGVAIRPPEALNVSEILPGRWEYGLPHQ